MFDFLKSKTPLQKLEEVIKKESKSTFDKTLSKCSMTGGFDPMAHLLFMSSFTRLLDSFANNKAFFEYHKRALNLPFDFTYDRFKTFAERIIKGELDNYIEFPDREPHQDTHDCY